MTRSRLSPRAAAPLRKLSVILPAVAVALAAMWLYRRALGLAYFNDDPTGHFAWMEGQSLLQFFSSSAEYGYYRPVVFTLLRVSELIFGNPVYPHNPVADHALLLLLHGVNAALVWKLAARMSGNGAFASAAALVFATVPFSYEAVAYVASLTHPLLVFWLLATLLLYDRGRGFTPLALLTMTLGLLTHENGIFIFAALVGFDWVMRPRATLRERVATLWPFVSPLVLFVAVWLIIPKNSQQGLNSLAEISRNTIPFLQTLAYPLLPLLRLGAEDLWLLVAVTLLFVAAMGLVAWRLGAWRLWVFALGWVALSSLPALLFLGPAYVYGSPRLGYLPAVGVGLLWAIPALWCGASLMRRDSAVRVAAGGLLFVAGLGVLIAPPLPFIRCQLDFYEDTSLFAREMARSATEAVPGRAVVFVNAPFFFSSTSDHPAGCPSPYPWTPVGAVLIPPYAQARDFVRFNGGSDREVTGVTSSAYAPGWRTFGPEISMEALREHAADDATFVFELAGGSFGDLTAAWRPAAPAAGGALASFGGALSLTDALAEREARQLAVRLEWRVDGEVGGPLAAFVHIYDASGVLVAQSDGSPGDGLVPDALWRVGDALRDERRLDLTALPPGTYQVAVGVYRASDGARLAAESDGNPLPDEIFAIYLFTNPWLGAGSANSP